MKGTYIIAIFFIVALIVALILVLIFSFPEEEPYFRNIAKNAPIFIACLTALLAAVIALSTADPKKESVKISIEKPYIKYEEKEEYKENELDNNLKSCYKSFPVTSYRIHFKMRNISGFDLENPVFTFNKLPIDKQRPYSETKDRPYSKKTFTFSIVRPDKKAHFIEVDKKHLISLDGLPYWNKDNEIDLWIRMVINEEDEEFEVDVSVNCENADGLIQTVQINPKTLLKDISNNEMAETNE